MFVVDIIQNSCFGGFPICFLTHQILILFVVAGLMGNEANRIIYREKKSDTFPGILSIARIS